MSTLIPEPVEEPLDQRVQRDLQEAMNDCPGPIKGGMIVTKFVVIAEVYTAEDGSVLRIISTDQMAIWDQIGMLTFALNDLQHDSLMGRLVEMREDEDE